jgi:hypothetical protein
MFNAGDFLALALKLVGSEPNEAGYRTATNRVYYACHLIGRESASKKGWFNPKFSADDHHALCRELNKRTLWGGKLRSLLELREHVDYHMEPRKTTNNLCHYCSSNEKENWERAKAIAEDIFPRIQNLAP